MSELARTLGLENSTVTRLIARLERNNYVTRKKSEEDKRSIKSCYFTNQLYEKAQGWR